MREIVTDHIGDIKLGGTLLPGIFESIEVTGRVKRDSVPLAGVSGSSTQPMGYEDATITLRVRLVNDDKSRAIDKMRTLVQVFKKTDDQARPYLYRITNELTQVWGIREVIFEELRSRASNQDDTLWADLVFQEYRPVLVQKETRAAQSRTDAGAKQGFAQQPAAAPAAKPASSPAVDDEKPPGVGA